MEFTKESCRQIKSKRAFSTVAIDQAREQINACVKGDNGATASVGLRENPAALLRRVISGLELARLIGKFESSTEKRYYSDRPTRSKKKKAQVVFAADVKPLSAAIEEIGTPSTGQNGDLLVLDSRNIAG